MDLYFEISEIKKTQETTLALLKELQKNGVVDNKEKVYDLTDLEDLFHVSRRTLFKWKSEGKLIFTQIGKKLYVTEAELKKFLKNNQNG